MILFQVDLFYCHEKIVKSKMVDREKSGKIVIKMKTSRNSRKNVFTSRFNLSLLFVPFNQLKNLLKLVL